jgi:hypothetical protein
MGEVPARVGLPKYFRDNGESALRRKKRACRGDAPAPPAPERAHTSSHADSRRLFPAAPAAYNLSEDERTLRADSRGVRMIEYPQTLPDLVDGEQSAQAERSSVFHSREERMRGSATSQRCQRTSYKPLLRFGQGGIDRTYAPRLIEIIEGLRESWRNVSDQPDHTVSIWLLPTEDQVTRVSAASVDHACGDFSSLSLPEPRFHL